MTRESVQAYPLQWPTGKPRTKFIKPARFETTFGVARDGLAIELDRLGAKNAVLSTNVELRLDGIPYANRSEPSDRGIAVYFTYKGQQLCFACDQWDRVKDNIQAVKKTIEALRGITRWGSGDMMEQAFSGFQALPAYPSKLEWWEVLGVGPDCMDQERMRDAYRQKAQIVHPDRGGSTELMMELNAAFEKAKLITRAVAA